MSKSEQNEQLSSTEEITDLKPIQIKRAAIKDMQCKYSYELMTGPTKGDTLNRNGVHLIHDDLIASFDELDVFIAQIDGAFRSWSNNQTPLSDLETHEELSKYKVLGFKIQGIEENKSVVFSGTKEVNEGTISFDTPKIKFNGSYLYIEELLDRLNHTISEVEKYMNGKTAPQHEQTFMSFEEEDDHDFEGAKV